MIPRRSRTSAAPAGERPEPEAPPAAEPITPRERTVDAAVTAWQAALEELSGASALWDVGTLGEAVVDLTAAHPSGIAQLFAGRPTRLSNLIREGAALAQARRRMREVTARTDELAQRYGLVPIYVAVGIASWSSAEPAAQTPDGHAEPAGPDRVDEETGSGGAPHPVRAPVLLRPVRIRTGDADADVELELDPAVELNPVLVRDLQDRGVGIDPGGLAAATVTPHGFAPQAALDAIAGMGESLKGFGLDRSIVIGAFVHPGRSLSEDLDALRDRLANHSLVAALAGDETTRNQLAAPGVPEPVGPDRPPERDRGAGDLDRSQQQVLDAVAAGAHLLVDTPPGSDAAGTAAGILAQAVTDGRRVLYVPGTRHAARMVVERMRHLGVDEVLLDLCGDRRWRTNAVQRVVAGLDPAVPEVDLQERERRRAQLTDVRRRLDGFVAALHRQRPPWQASAYEALQALAELTSRRPGPRTRVQLRGRLITLDGAGRIEAREALARAAGLGAFRLRAADTPWFGAELTSAEHAVATLENVRRLSELMPTLREQVDSTAAQTGLDEAATFAQWGEQLELLEGVRASLDIFTSQVFERSAADMAAATASRSWRAAHGVEMGWTLRRRLRRQAKDLIRPGVSVPDLHTELMNVQTRREAWREACSDGSWPHLPRGLREFTRTYSKARELFDDLTDVLAPTLGGQRLDEVPLADLQVRLERLGADDASVRQMPERAAALSVLNSMGLGELVQDLTTRRVPTRLVGAEFELAWWSSVLEQMLTDDPALAGMDADTLAEMTEEFRRLDQAHVDSLSLPVRQALRSRVRTAIEADRMRAQDLYRAARGGLSDVKEMLARFSAVAWEPRPVWMVPPMVVPTVLGPTDRVDLLVLDTVHHLPVEQVISAIARADQVVVLGDSRRGGTGLAEQVSWLPTVTLAGGRVVQEPQIAAFLAGVGYATLLRPVPAPPRAAPIRLELVEGTGMPAPDAHEVESVQAEVDRVVDAVIDHALTRPQESLAVIALNARHADRIQQAVQDTVQGSRALAGFFDAAAPEAFTVVDIEAVAGLRRDAVILSLGFGKTPHGRVLHRFGAVSGPGGAAYLIDALDAVRRRLTVVSCFSAEDLDPKRLRTRGAELLRAVLQFAAHGAVPDQVDEADHTPDPLLNDLTQRLRRRGLRVVPRYGRFGGVRIPLAVGHPELPGELVLAVLTDDADYVAEPSLRARERHWVQRLEQRGWHVRMVFSPTVFMDPQAVADQIAAHIADIVAERNGAPPPPTHVAPPASVGEEDTRVRTNATLSALRGEQIAGTHEPGAIDAVPSPGERIARPSVEPGRPLGDYGDDDLDALLQWIASDGRTRTAEQLRTDLAGALGITRRGKHVTTVLDNAVRRSGLAGEDGAARTGDDDGEDGAARTGDDDGEDGADRPAGGNGRGSAPGRVRSRSNEPVIPDRAAEDDPRSWGEHDEDDDERHLRERPPHWG